MDKLLDDSIILLHNLLTPSGFLASSIEADNYKRVWARDSVVCGLAGILLEDAALIEGLRNSLISLTSGQHELGMIPSNVQPDDASDVSYGSLVGRVDATTWFVVGCCLYYLNTKDDEFWKQQQSSLLKARRYLKTIEFNDKGWIYTPLSGNWADEYPVHGYTLYDNALRIWGESLWQKCSGMKELDLPALKAKTETNFWPSEENNENTIYQKVAYNRSLQKQPQHYVAFILPGKYDLRFDAAANALFLLQTQLSLKKKAALRKFLSELKRSLQVQMIPAFWPPITEESEDWNLLEGNYSYDFKNKPGYFHNGGIWPVWMGLFCVGLTLNGLQEEAAEITSAFERHISNKTNWDFQEYIDVVNFELNGKSKMGYTASGIVFMHFAGKSDLLREKLHI